MIKTALKSREAGIAFAAVHDSFWTHPSDVDKMNELIRESFIELHSGNLVENLRDEFVTRYAGYYTLMQVPSASKLAARIREIRSTYQKAKVPPLVQELQMELDRQDMLASEEAGIREKAEKIVTPTSLFLDHKAAMEAYRNRISSGVSPAIDGLDDNDAIIPLEEDVEAAAPAKKKTVKKTKVVKDTEDGDQLADGTVPEHIEPEKVGSSKMGQTQLWVPLLFPPVPAKGAFDVSRVRDSPYFFS